MLRNSLLDHATVHTNLQQLRMQHRLDKTKSINTQTQKGAHEVRLEAEELSAVDVHWESVLCRDVDMIYKYFNYVGNYQRIIFLNFSI